MLGKTPKPKPAAKKTAIAPKPAAVKKAATAAPAGAPKRRNGLSRDKILAVATKLFAERGYAGISIRDIAGACDIGIPSIYHFFGDKDSLYVSCCQQLFGEVEETLRNSLKETDSREMRVFSFTVTLCDILLKKRDFRRLLQMGLLQDEHRGIEDITAHNFMSAFQMLIKSISDLAGAEKADERAMMIFALVFGQIELHRVAQMANADVTLGGNPEPLARHVLNVALPGHDWTL
jgi:AcrR family transcriptional regulator